jgi:CheY-like chemotaxis protein
MSAPPNSGHSGIAPEIAVTLAGKRIGLCGFEAAQASRISAVLRRVNAISNGFKESWLIDSGHLGDLLLIKLGCVSSAAMEAAAGASVPVMLVGPGESLLEGAAGAYAWGRELLSEPWTDAELLIRAFRLVSGIRPFASRAADQQRPLVLIADDDPSWIALVEATLRSHGVACETACDGMGALQTVRELLPDLLMLDLQMPGMGGFEVLETVRLDPRLENLPVVLLTACQEDEDVNRGSALRADGYLVKPLSPTLLFNRIKRILNSLDGGGNRSGVAGRIRGAPLREPVPTGRQGDLAERWR